MLDRLADGGWSGLRGALLALAAGRGAAPAAAPDAVLAVELRQLLVDRRVDEARVRVAVHQRVDLQLGLVERVRCGRHHVLVDDLSHSGVQAHLQAEENEQLEAPLV